MLLSCPVLIPIELFQNLYLQHNRTPAQKVESKKNKTQNTNKLPFLKNCVPLSQSKHDSKAVIQKSKMTAVLTFAISGSTQRQWEDYSYNKADTVWTLYLQYIIHLKKRKKCYSKRFSSFQTNAHSYTLCLHSKKQKPNKKRKQTIKVQFYTSYVAQCNVTS